jgi:hypothetical protein
MLCSGGCAPCPNDDRTASSAIERILIQRVPAATQPSGAETFRLAEPKDLQVTLMNPVNPSDHYPLATVKVYNVADHDVIVGYEPGCVVIHCGGFEQHGPAMTFTRRREILRPRQPLEFEVPAGGWMRTPAPGDQDLLLPVPLPSGKYQVWATFQLSGSTLLVESPRDTYVVP